MQFYDALFRELNLQDTPKRIVSLVPSLTEALCDLGLEDHLVGVTKFCVHPHNIRKTKTVVGGTKQVHLDRIASLSPDIVIANKEENTPEIVAQLEAICPVWVTDVQNIGDNLHLLEQFGEVFDRKAEAKHWTGKIRLATEQFERPELEKTTAYLIWKSPWMAAGKGSFIDSMLRANGLRNIFDKPRYPEFGLGELARLQPETVLLSSEPFPFKNEHVAEIQHYIPSAKVLLVDGEMFSWFGTRPGKAFEYFKSLQDRIA